MSNDARAPVTAGVPAILSAPAASQVASVSTSDASIMLDARTILIESASVPDDALVIVRAVRNDRVVDDPIGQVRLGPGRTSNPRVPLMRAAIRGESLLVTLHADYGRKGVNDGDPVVLSVDISEDVLRSAREPGRAVAR